MLGVHGIPVDTDKIEVRTVHNNLDKLPAENKAKFIEIDAVPQEPAYVKGKRNVLYINPSTKALWYEQVDRPLSSEEAMSDLATALASQNAQMSAKLDQLITLQTEANKLAKGV